MNKVFLRRAAIVLLVLVAIGATAAFLARDVIAPLVFQPTGSTTETVPLPSAEKRMASIVEALSGLHTPWEVALVPGGGMLVTERNGKLTRLFPDGTRKSYPVPGVVEYGEGGLLGMVLDPGFESNSQVYLYSTTKKGSKYLNRVIRYKLDGDGLTEEKTVLGDIPGAQYHAGGRIAFGPDSKLYVTTGDAQDTKNAQNPKSLAGKILRIEADGSIPADNPFGNATWSYGHRNPQGIAWDDRGRLWATEHGRSGASTGLDELNLIVKGGNYGWPLIQGDERREGMITPVINSGAAETWAPSGMAFMDGRLFFAGLRGSSLYEARLDDGEGVSRFRAHVRREFGRLRAVHASGRRLFVSTSNTDGRGTASDKGDLILRIDLGYFD